MKRIFFYSILFLFVINLTFATTYNFTNCNKSGRYGPSQADCDNEYSGTNLEGNVTVASGIQNWTVPKSGFYRITAYGAQGGDYYNHAAYGGKGARIRGDFYLNQGDVIKILVGQKGGDNPYNNRAGGGGGGTYIVTDTNDILIIAGGGGGTYGGSCSNVHGQNATRGNNGCGSGGVGGTNGAGGSIASTQLGGAGAGWNSNGQNAKFGVQGGFNFTNGGAGGFGDISNGQNGGFGGGGGAMGDAGGGGGYSGGGAGKTAAGGGGGSISNGDDSVLISGVNEGHGYVEISPFYGVNGDEDDVTTTGVTDLAIEIDGTPLNETGTLTGTQNLTFKDQGKTLVIVSHDFDSVGVDISSWTIAVDTGFVGIDDNNEVVGTKTIYVDKLDNVDSLCVKDAAGVTSADDISDACDQANEYNFTACIDSTHTDSGISCSDTGTRFVISGLQHSGAEQQGSNNVPEFGLIGYLLASLGSYFGIKFKKN